MEIINQDLMQKSNWVVTSGNALLSCNMQHRPAIRSVLISKRENRNAYSVRSITNAIISPSIDLLSRKYIMIWLAKYFIKTCVGLRQLILFKHKLIKKFGRSDPPCRKLYHADTWTSCMYLDTYLRCSRTKVWISLRDRFNFGPYK